MNSSTVVNSSETEFDQNLNALRNISFFSELGLQPLKALAYLCKRIRYRPDDYIFTQGDLDTQAYCLLSGAARVIRDEDERQVVLRVLETGAFIGALSLVAQTKRLFSLQAVEPTLCLVLPQKHFLNLVSKSPDLSANFFKALYRSLYRWEEELLSRTNRQDLQQAKDFLGVTLL
ncbi:cAMP-binding domain of CRP or a regulatory subunit of cAMP-dependent protein kinases [Desulfonatronum thiosulfatophilum]|uniref:cAMP-binding domain of CRP or a regulatory subunit of cAMP-dependent protein kinases n=1 Tax=Desulfonatronum thiosulfatophilum TaxID=617002 RepID=A0A1G6AJ87_9BACT|nr:cyclic nucleotide-binding domain-containing protein [Desulfonatronum thiosulfatophilum]SDB08435.1 cAMP-binding domain of CRP or a regulatory subunit of cAMP-dependent protein kinases [Desulfonatronum thiosulfatophilum]